MKLIFIVILIFNLSSINNTHAEREAIPDYGEKDGIKLLISQYDNFDFHTLSSNSDSTDSYLKELKDLVAIVKATKSLMTYVNVSPEVPDGYRGKLLFSGMDPKGISDVAVRESYEKDIAMNEKNSILYGKLRVIRNSLTEAIRLNIKGMSEASKASAENLLQALLSY